MRAAWEVAFRVFKLRNRYVGLYRAKKRGTSYEVDGESKSCSGDNHHKS
jgi:hypothetical protein